MNRRTRGVLLVGSLAVATAVVLAVALPWDSDQHCEIGFPMLIHCKSSSTTTTYSGPTSTTQPSSGPRDTIESSSGPRNVIKSSWTRRSHSGFFQSGYADETLWAVTIHCPEDYIAKHLPCAVGSVPMQGEESDYLKVKLSEATGLPLPKLWGLTTVKKSPFIESVHAETLLDLAAVLDFYRVELRKRGWAENDGAVVEPDQAAIAFTTTDGPALLRLIHQDDRTIADLSVRKPAAANAGIQPRPGQVRLIVGNDTDEEAVITINEQTIKLAAGAGRDLTDNTGRKSPDSPEIALPPGKYKVTLEVASGAAQNRELEVAADETWGLLVGPAGVPLPVHLY